MFTPEYGSEDAPEFNYPPPEWFDCLKHNWYGQNSPCPKCDEDSKEEQP